MVAVETEVGIVELNNNGRVFVVLVLMSSPSSHIASKSNFGVTSQARVQLDVAWSLSPTCGDFKLQGSAAVAAVRFT